MSTVNIREDNHLDLQQFEDRIVLDLNTYYEIVDEEIKKDVSNKVVNYNADNLGIVCKPETIRYCPIAPRRLNDPHNYRHLH